MKISYEAASNVPLHMLEAVGNEGTALYGYGFWFDNNNNLGMNFSDGIVIGSGLTLNIVPVGNDRLRVTCHKISQPIRAADDLPTRADIVKQLLDAGLTPAEASEMASIEVEIGMARDD